MKKVLIIAVLFAVLGVSFLMQPTEGKTKPYYSGKTVSYNGTFYVGTVNTGDFELFALQGKQLVKVTDIQSLDPESKEFDDLLFVKADGNLYAYLVNGRYLYKYDISNPEIPTVLTKVKDNSWDWFTRVEMVNGNLVTIGSKGMKVWNSNLQVIQAYSMINNSTLGYSQFVDQGKLIVNLKDKLDVYNTASMQKVSEYSIAVNNVGASRTITSDDNLIYLVDDQSLKAVDFDGNVVRQFDHAGVDGYNVIDSTDPNYLYFSDGLGIVKVDKETFQPVSWDWTSNNGPSGSWAMGLSSANDANGEKIAIFNGSNIMVLDQNMKTLATYMSVEKDNRPAQPLSLSIDKNFAAANSQVAISGTGFGLNETLKIEFNKVKVAEVNTDDFGSFQTIITVPTVGSTPLSTDIKVTGETSKLTYSTSFRIE
ncbi:MAG TPA: hypothetical protein VMC41_04070 [Candidatus Nanoarchaeia archaeon]|nr:hypothetical protein [Candidatus Nanoarchaeia archaeon]